jgi:hypothetical protein
MTLQMRRQRDEAKSSRVEPKSALQEHIIAEELLGQTHTQEDTRAVQRSGSDTVGSGCGTGWSRRIAAQCRELQSVHDVPRPSNPLQILFKSAHNRPVVHGSLQGGHNSINITCI